MINHAFNKYLKNDNVTKKYLGLDCVYSRFHIVYPWWRK